MALYVLQGERAEQAFGDHKWLKLEPMWQAYTCAGTTMEVIARSADEAAMHEWGKLLFLGKDGQPAEQYTIAKSTVVLGRSGCLLTACPR